MYSRCDALWKFWTSQACVYLLVEFAKYWILVYLFLICRAKIRSVTGKLQAIQLNRVCHLDWGFLLQAKIPLPVTFLVVSIKQCLKPCRSSVHNFQKNLFPWINQYKKLLKALCYNLNFPYFFWFTKNVFSFVPCKHSFWDKTIPNFNFFFERSNLFHLIQHSPLCSLLIVYILLERIPNTWHIRSAETPGLVMKVGKRIILYHLEIKLLFV